MNNYESGRTATIKNQNFAIIHLLDNQPYKQMWVREVMKNCIQATHHFVESNPDCDIPQEVHIRSLPLYEWDDDYEFTQPKLSFLNPGGMTNSELQSSVDLYSSGNEKDQCLDGNYGIGESSTLPQFTKVIKISCKNGKVFVLDYSIEGTGDNRKFKISDTDEITEWAKDFAQDRGYDRFMKDGEFVYDWTETILFGSEVHHNTAVEPNKLGVSEHKYLAGRMCDRFYDIPSTVKIKFINEKKMAFANSAYFKTRLQVFNETKKQFTEINDEVVQVDNAKIHYLYHGPKRTEGTEVNTNHPVHFGIQENFTSARNCSGLLWGPFGEREIYSPITRGRDWERFCSSIGIFSQHKYFSIFVELSTADYKTNQYRTYLVDRSLSAYTTEEVKLDNFKNIITNNMPQWYKDKIAEHDTSTKVDIEDLWKELTADFESDFGDTKPGKGGARTTDQERKPTQRKNEKRGNKPARGKSKASRVSFAVPTFRHESKAFDNKKLFARYEPLGGDNNNDLYIINNEHALIDKIMDAIDPDANSGIRDTYCKKIVSYLSIYVARKVAITSNYRDSVNKDFDVRKLHEEESLTLDAATYKDVIVSALKKDYYKALNSPLNELEEVA